MSYHHPTMEERNVIYRPRWMGRCDAEIARCLGRQGSVVDNCGVKEYYRDLEVGGISGDRGCQ